MTFQKGNQFWKTRSSHGRKPIFKKQEDLWDACVEYFQWVEDNPLQEEKIFHNMGKITRTTVSHMRAMTLAGLCLFLDIDETTWYEYAKKCDFSHVCTRIKNYIYDQKFSGAAADMLNPSIIARDLGLADKTQSNNKNEQIGDINTKTEITITHVKAE